MATESDLRPEERKASIAGPDQSVFAPLRSPLFRALWVAGAAASIADGLTLAEASLRDGPAHERMEAFVAVTGRLGRAVA